jgi:ubiquinone/menaquinone biosynthesis C-methylase UbiE
LHVGCGGDALPDWLHHYDETRLDIDETQCPDIVASMLDMGDIGQFDALLCRHALEHVYPHEVGQALGEFRRVLKDGGHAMVFVPDLEGVAPTNEVLFEAPSGPITGHDLFYGYGRALTHNPYMAHKCGFVKETLEAAFKSAGFTQVKTTRIGNYDLMGVGIK